MTTSTTFLTLTIITLSFVINTAFAKTCLPGQQEVKGYCEDCLKGYYSYDGVGECKKCPVGKVATRSGSSTCYSCYSGFYAINGVYCQLCPDGTISRPDSSSKEDCVLCPTGSIWKRKNWDTGETGCEDCSATKFDYNRTTCVSTCPMGTYTLKSEKTCEKCAPGTISGPGASECVKCKAGSYERDRNICYPCSAGYYCLEGTSGQSGSIKCPPGTISEGGASKCDPCGPGSYATESYDHNYDSKRPKCEKCEPGAFGVDGISCNLCPNGTIATGGASECTPCAEGLLSWKNNTECLTSKQIQDLQNAQNVPSGGGIGSYIPYLLGVVVLAILVSVVVYKRNKKQVQHQDFENEEEADLVGNQGANYQRYQ